MCRIREEAREASVGPWSQFVAENPKAENVQLFAYTGAGGALGVVLNDTDEETETLVREFVSEHNPPRPVHYVSP